MLPSFLKKHKQNYKEKHLRCFNEKVVFKNLQNTYKHMFSTNNFKLKIAFCLKYGS